MRQHPYPLHLLFTAMLLLGPLRCPAAETRTLAQVCADFGVSEKTNTMLHATERDAKGFNGRTFFLPGPNPAAAAEIPRLWQALAKTKYMETRIKEPKEAYTFIVLNTGSSSKMPPVEEIWIDSDGLLHFLADHQKRPREFMVFSGPEVVAWAAENMKTYGQVRP